jgi:hypothetical protein
MQLKREFRARKSKEIQGKSLAFPWIPFVESVLFNALQRIQIKNFFSASTRVPGCGLGPLMRVPRSILPSPNPPAAGLSSLNGKNIARISVFERFLRFFPPTASTDSRAGQTSLVVLHYT